MKNCLLIKCLIVLIIIYQLNKTNAFVTSCWGGYTGLTLDQLAAYIAKGVMIPLANQTIAIKAQFNCPSTSTGCLVEKI